MRLAMAKILVVDDDTLVRTSLSYALEDALDRESFDAVVLDILMPEREGIETIREIRKKWAALPVLAISGGDKTGWSDFLRMASVLGANDTLAKPFTATDFVDRVVRLVNGAKA
jgi:DNA-binding response OmpR family regulator